MVLSYHNLSNLALSNDLLVKHFAGHNFCSKKFRLEPEKMEPFKTNKNQLLGDSKELQT